MRNDIIEFLGKEVKERCISPDNFFGKDSYDHISAVVKNAEILADAYGADKEVVIISAWLHDIASITNYDLYKEHHVHGVYIARELLERVNYPNEKIELVEKCILNHRGSVAMEKSSLEEICVADADAVSHFYNIPGLLYFVYTKKNLELEEGIDFVINKLERSYNKLSQKSKGVYKEVYKQAMKVLDYNR